MVEEFIDTTDPSKTLVLADRLMINQCFYHFKHLFKDMLKKKVERAHLNFLDQTLATLNHQVKQQLKKLKILKKFKICNLKYRDLTFWYSSVIMR
jgi:hypothetical protein